MSLVLILGKTIKSNMPPAAKKQRRIVTKHRTPPGTDLHHSALTQGQLVWGYWEDDKLWYLGRVSKLENALFVKYADGDEDHDEELERLWMLHEDQNGPVPESLQTVEDALPPQGQREPVAASSSRPVEECQGASSLPEEQLFKGQDIFVNYFKEAISQEFADALLTSLAKLEQSAKIARKIKEAFKEGRVPSILAQIRSSAMSAADVVRLAVDNRLQEQSVRDHLDASRERHFKNRTIDTNEEDDGMVGYCGSKVPREQVEQRK